MNNKLDASLKAVISLLEEMTSSGTMEPGQKKAIKNAIQDLRRAARTGDPDKIRKAIALVAVVFLRKFG